MAILISKDFIESLTNSVINFCYQGQFGKKMNLQKSIGMSRDIKIITQVGRLKI